MDLTQHDKRVDALTNAELDEQIVTWSGRIAAGEARLLALVAEFDRREAWGGPGLLSCAHWLSWRTGLSPGAARERVRVAKALTGLPVLASALAAGRVSFSQLRAITRVAEPGDEQRWLDLARSTTGGQLERLVRGIRRVRRLEQARDDPEQAAWRMRASAAYDADGTLVLSVRLPAQDGAVVMAALEQLQHELDRAAAADRGAKPAPGGEPATEVPPLAATAAPTSRATLTQAIVELARRSLEQVSQQHPEQGRRARVRLTAHVDPLSGWGRLRDGELLPPVVLRGVPGCPSPRIDPAAPGAEGTSPFRAAPEAVSVSRFDPRDAAHCRFDVGRSARVPSATLRELLGTLDGERCRFPGCSRRRRLHAHHVRFWSRGGRTDLSNLALLCERHHTLAHAAGFELTLRADRSITVRTATGEQVPHLQPLPWGEAAALDPDGRVTAGTLPPSRVESRMDLGYCVSVLVQQAA